MNERMNTMNRRTSIIVVAIIILVILGVVLYRAIPEKFGEKSSQAVVKAPSNCTEALASQSFAATPYTGILTDPKFPASITSASPLYDPETKTSPLDYKTQIQNAMKNGVNYAGRYVVAEWGLGTSYQGHAIVDGQSGQIVYYGLNSDNGVSHTASSTLLVVNPVENFTNYSNYDEAKTKAHTLTRRFYTITNGALTQICAESADLGW